MDKRFIFRYRSWTIKSSSDAGWGRSSVALELLRPSSQGTISQAPVRRRAADGTRGVGRPGASLGYSIEPCLQEKPGGGCRERPYRKPTLVAGCESTKVDE